MPRRPKVIPGPSRLSKILAQLTADPRPQLINVRSLRLTLALRNDHFGARHFMKEDLPRIKYANPALDVQVNKVPKTAAELWEPEMAVEFSDGSTQTLSLDKKWSSTIFRELMDMAGGTPWQRWKKERVAAGLPIVEPPTPRSAHSLKHIGQLLNVGKTGAAAVLP